MPDPEAIAREDIDRQLQAAGWYNAVATQEALGAISELFGLGGRCEEAVP